MRHLQTSAGLVCRPYRLLNRLCGTAGTITRMRGVNTAVLRDGTKELSDIVLCH